MSHHSPQNLNMSSYVSNIIKDQHHLESMTMCDYCEPFILTGHGSSKLRSQKNILVIHCLNPNYYAEIGVAR